MTMTHDEYQAEIRRLKKQLAEQREGGTLHALPDPPPRPSIRMSDVVRMLLERPGQTEHSSVTLTRNSRGVTQVDVTVRTGDVGEITSPEQAAAEARRLYDNLTALYPPEPPVEKRGTDA